MAVIRDSRSVNLDEKLQDNGSPISSPQDSESSTSDDDFHTPGISSPWTRSPGTRINQAESMVGVSISRAQTRLASAATPAIEKENAIREGGGYFVFNNVVNEPNDESPLSDFGFDGANDQDINGREGIAGHKTILVQLPEEVAVPPASTFEDSHPHSKRAKSIPTTPSEATEAQIKQLHSQRPPASIRRSSSDGSLSMRRALSTASSLGDDSRFENVKEQVNSRFKAIKDSFQDTSFRLPQMPKIPNILSVTKAGTKDDDSSSVESSRKVSSREAIAPLRNRSILPRTLNIKNNSSSVSNVKSNDSIASTHPYFTKAMQGLTGDLVVMGGYRGSVLRSREPPNSRCWVPLKAGFNLAKVDLQVGLHDEDEEKMTEMIYPDGMLTHIGPVDISRRLFKKLRNTSNVRTGELRVINYGYDWRLSPLRLSQQLLAYIAQLPCNSPETPPSERGAWVIAHSLGGLITRHAVNQRPDLFRGVVYAGTPSTCVNILGPLRNGDDVLFNSKILTAQVNFTIRTSYALLPLDGKCFVDESTKEELPIDFFDVKNWIKHELSPCVIRPRRRSSVAQAKNSIFQTIPQIVSKSMGGVVDNIQTLGRRTSIKQHNPAVIGDASNNTVSNQMSGETGLAPQMSSNDVNGHSKATSRSRANTCSIPFPEAVDYLTRTLAAAKQFKQELAAKDSLVRTNAYPPAAVIFGKSEPTVSAARVKGYKAIARPDAYDNLAFASGDGVVLARAAMLPDGYKAVKGGVIASDRGHITLLGDLEAVGKALIAIIRARSHGVGNVPPCGEADDELDEKGTASNADL